MGVELKIGDYILVETQTKDNTFGRCLYKIIGPTKMAPIQKGGPDVEQVLCEMLGGSGPAARPGLRIWDTFAKMGREVLEGRTKILPPDQAAKMERQILGGPRGSVIDAIEKPHSGSGCHEIDSK